MFVMLNHSAVGTGLGTRKRVKVKSKEKNAREMVERVFLNAILLS